LEKFLSNLTPDMGHEQKSSCSFMTFMIPLATDIALAAVSLMDAAKITYFAPYVNLFSK